MSPQTYENFLRHNHDFEFDLNKEDAFALGMTFLESIGGYDVRSLYGRAGFNSEQLSEFIEEFTQNCRNNQILNKCLRSLLEV